MWTAAVLLVLATALLLAGGHPQGSQGPQDSQDSVVPSDAQRTLNNNNRCARPGLCPYVRRLIPAYYDGHGHEKDLYGHADPPSLCGNLCVSDDTCPLGKKCCATHCGYACYDAIIIHE